ncbi:MULTISPECIES: hypothetical protein [unclassified Mucilaginibacter]|uniref:hypothetical protein n=1 Tax=unclassified Mucilaginibacter TaxID=2617802 RepID=UPI002AC8F458|nr:MULTISPECIES: hypothetical protein [unclassified Mucilaginibacter]MEB0261587.1 hypothetical protein [Mucilaginibacter sp. 10I4]MEB0277160.1 hypothetical protein [Mucilaginibacter sp. 10B2]MEB0300807.1 hypothetical protein [Mucilaginibacter sp. 5C4]WPX25259.1 hypothetical protein RHM67_08270 [Mucilaginibacter sp. 5C4]
MFKNSLTLRPGLGIFNILLLIITITGIAKPLFGQSKSKNPWVKEIGVLPPVSSLTDGFGLKGELHVHSRHSKES